MSCHRHSFSIHSQRVYSNRVVFEASVNMNYWANSSHNRGTCFVNLDVNFVENKMQENL